MKERGVFLDKYISGLRPYSRPSFNQSNLTTCTGFAARPEGLKKAPDLTDYLSAVSTDFPFPQIHIGANYWLCCTRDKIYLINANKSVTLKLTISVTSPQPWHIADSFKYVVMSNGESTIVVDPDTGVWTEHTADSLMPVLSTVLNFKGQLIASPVSTWYDTTSNSIIWSEVGAVDFSIDQSNSRGYRPMPWSGQVYKIMQLTSEFFVVYGSNGIAVFKFIETTPSLIKHIPFGIASRDAVNGDENRHVFVDTKGNLRILTSDLNISDGVYKEFISQMIGNNIIVTYEPIEKDFYLTDGTVGFLYTNEGLTEVTQGPTTMSTFAGDTVAMVEDLGDDDLIFTTDTYDFNVRGLKTLDIIEVAADTDGDVSVAIGYNFERGDTFEFTSYVDLNQEGTVTFPVTANEFRFKVKVENSTYCNISYIHPRLKFDDKRFKRGASNVG